MPRPLTPSENAIFLGLNQEDGTKINEQQASILQNLYPRNDGRELYRRGGIETQALVSVDPATAFDGLHYARISEVDWIIAAQAGKLFSMPPTGTGTAVSGVLFAPGVLVGGAFLPYSMYFGDGINQNARWNGSTAAVVQCSQPGSGTTGVPSGSGSLFSNYTYKVTFTSADGNDSQPSAPSASILAAGAAQIALSNIPTAPAGEGCTGRRLWRTIQGGTDWYLVGTIANNTATTFTDTTADANVDTSQAVDASVVRFPPCRILVGHQLRLCGIINESSEGDTKTLYLSDYQKPWTCANVAPLTQVDDPTLGARIPLQDTPTGLIAYGNVLIVWFAGQTWRLIGDNPNNWSFDRWLSIGCVAHRTARVYRTSLIWLAADGIYAVEGVGDGISVNRISDDIRTTLDSLSAEDLAAAHAFTWFDRYYICFPTVSKAFYFDLKYRQWGELTNWAWDHAVVAQATGTNRERIYATAHAFGEYDQLETGSDDNGAAIPVHWKTRDKDLGQFAREKRVHRIECRFAAGSGVATVNLYRGGGELLQTFTQDLSDVIRTGSNVSELIDRVVEGARDEYFALEILHSALSADFRILTAGWQWSLCT